MASFLFVFNVLLERVVLLPGAVPMSGPGPPPLLGARVQFLYLPPLEAGQGCSPLPQDGNKPHGATAFAGFTEKHTTPFHSDAATMSRALQEQPLVVTLYQQHHQQQPVVLGTARVPVAVQFDGLLARANKCATRHPVVAVVHGEYPVCGSDGAKVGAVTLTARLVCFDNNEAAEHAVNRLHVDASRSTTASASSRRSSGPSGPCSDDRLITTTTNVCPKCLLPKRPPSTSGGYSHLKNPSQATIIEEAPDAGHAKGLADPGPSSGAAAALAAQGHHKAAGGHQGTGRSRTRSSARSSRQGPREPHPDAGVGSSTQKRPASGALFNPKACRAPKASKAACGSKVTVVDADEVLRMFAWDAETHLGASSGARPSRSFHTSKQQASLGGSGSTRRTRSKFRASLAAAIDRATLERDCFAPQFRRTPGLPPRMGFSIDLSAPLPTKYGHMNCAIPPSPVPGNCGWLWSTQSKDNCRRGRGWYPGLIPRALGLQMGLHTSHSG